MLKRKDWKLFEAAERAAKTRDTSLEGSKSADDLSSSSSDAGTDAEPHSASDASHDEGDNNRRLEDLSEDDFSDAEGSDPGAEIALLKEQWLEASKESGVEVPRAALACRLCKGVLILGPASLRQHIESKRHAGRLKSRPPDFEPIVFAANHLDDAKAETHRERLLRLKALAKPASGTSGTRARRSRSKLQSRGKPGKRQRAEMKAQRLKETEAASGEKSEARSETKGRKRKSGGSGAVSRAAMAQQESDVKAHDVKSSYWSTAPSKAAKSRVGIEQPTSPDILKGGKRDGTKKKKQKALL